MQPRCQSDADRTKVDVGWPTLDQSLGGTDVAFKMPLFIALCNTHGHLAGLDEWVE